MYLNTSLTPPVDEIEFFAMTAAFDYQDLRYAVTENEQQFECTNEAAVKR